MEIIKMDLSARKQLIYIGNAGLRGGTLHSRLSDHLKRKGWQTAFRRKVFEYVMGIAEDSRDNIRYKNQLKQSNLQITEAVKNYFIFKYLATMNFADFEILLIQKHGQQLWNKQKYIGKAIHNDFTQLEKKLLQCPETPFSMFEELGKKIPKEPGVYLIFKMN